MRTLAILAVLVLCGVVSGAEEKKSWGEKFIDAVPAHLWPKDKEDAVDTKKRKEAFRTWVQNALSGQPMELPVIVGDVTVVENKTEGKVLSVAMSGKAEKNSKVVEFSIVGLFPVKDRAKLEAIKGKTVEMKGKVRTATSFLGGGNYTVWVNTVQPTLKVADEVAAK